MSTKERLEVIDGLLNAYRQGWITYDSAHVKELRDERQKIKGVMRYEH